MKRGVITFVFDDGYREILDSIVPFLDSLSMPGVFALPLQQESLEHDTKKEFAPWEEWQKKLRPTHEIAAHSLTHTDLTKLTRDELLNQLETPKQTLRANTLVYPGGAHDDAVVKAATELGFSAARTVKKGFESLPPKDPMRLKTFNFTKHNFSLLKANILALYAFITNSWLIETYHIVSDTNTELLHTVSKKDFEKHLQFVARLGIPVKTIRNAVHNQTI